MSRRKIIIPIACILLLALPSILYTIASPSKRGDVTWIIDHDCCTSCEACANATDCIEMENEKPCFVICDAGCSPTSCTILTTSDDSQCDIEIEAAASACVENCIREY